MEKLDDTIKDLYLQTLGKFTQIPGINKTNKEIYDLLNKIKIDYVYLDIPNKKRACLSTLFNKAPKSNYVENTINYD